MLPHPPAKSAAQRSPMTKKLVLDLMHNPDKLNFKIDSILGNLSRPVLKKKNMNQQIG